VGKTVAKTPGYGPELVERICAEVATGESIADITKQPDFPSEKTVYRWLSKYAEFREAYAAARSLGIEKHANDIIAIADAAELTNENINKARLRIDARKWILAKLLPKKYGDSLALAGDSTRPLTVTISSEDAGIL
jgi:transposase-like protein